MGQVPSRPPPEFLDPQVWPSCDQATKKPEKKTTATMKTIPATMPTQARS